VQGWSIETANFVLRCSYSAHFRDSGSCRAAPGSNIDSRKKRGSRPRGKKETYLKMKLHFYNHALHSGQIPILNRQEHWVASGFAVPDVGITLLCSWSILGNQTNLKPIFNLMLTSRYPPSGFSSENLILSVRMRSSVPKSYVFAHLLRIRSSSNAPFGIGGVMPFSLASSAVWIEFLTVRLGNPKMLHLKKYSRRLHATTTRSSNFIRETRAGFNPKDNLCLMRV
jgi:hypothetical protein